MAFSWIKGTIGNQKKPYYWDIVISKIKNNEKILDYGAADCKLFDYFVENKIKFDGYTFDLDKESNKISKEKGYAPLNKISGKFNSIVMMDVIEHISFDDFQDLLGKFKRSLEKGGKLFIGTSNITASNFWNFFDDLTHVRPYPACPTKVYIESEGFECKLRYLEKPRNPFKSLMNILFRAKNYSYYVLECNKR